MQLELAAASCLLAGVLAVGYRRESRRHRQWQRSLLDPAEAPLDDCEHRLEPDGYPMLAGRFAGHTAEVRLIRDDVAVRKVPCLWLSVTVFFPLPGCPTLDMLARLRGTEFYAPLAGLPHRIEPPAHWPSEITVKCSAPQAPLAALSDLAADYFRDVRAKELLVTPKGVRLVHQLAQARRAEYLVLRAGHFDAEPVPRQHLLDLLTRTLDIARVLNTHVDRTRVPQAAP